MRIKRVAAGLVTVSATVLGLSLVTAGSAAALTGSWHAFGNTNPITSSSSSWVCAPSVTVSGVSAQVCEVFSNVSSVVQGAVIVRNNSSGVVPVAADVTVFHPATDESLGTWNCSSSGVAANSWSVCFGQSVDPIGASEAKGHANGADLGFTQPG